VGRIIFWYFDNLWLSGMRLKNGFFDIVLYGVEGRRRQDFATMLTMLSALQLVISKSSSNGLFEPKAVKIIFERKV
jgi:hypothetical protein